ncbi:MAG: hypothetical protein M3N19_09630, partial [Candidatus Eremiobacteraeota bacterium]|nr:hypothetical protein [Candidatus Eremiobacteraeota bacterium]
MAPSLFADGQPDRVTRYSVITFVCFIIVAGAWSIALSQADRVAHWQWYTLAGLTVATAITFYRWFRYARTTTLGLI